jgi:N-acetylneuraminic acid mutarotase
VVGGFNGEYVASAYRAPIRNDGGLGEWEEEEPLPKGRAGSGFALIDNTVIIVSGRTDEGDNAEVLLSKIGDDGRLGPWENAPSLPAGRFHVASLSVGRSVYALGGLEKGVAVETNFSAVLNSDGVLSEWMPVTAFPKPRSHHAAFTRGIYLFASGGLQGSPSGKNSYYADVLRAEVTEAFAGTIGAWESVSELPRPVAAHAATVVEDKLYLFGGVENNEKIVEHVRSAWLGGGESIGLWRTEPPLPKARAHVHQVPYHNGVLYSVGGNPNGAEAMVDASARFLRPR